MNIDVNAALRISSILSHGVEGEANTNKEYFNDLSEILTLAKSAGLTDEQYEQLGKTLKFQNGQLAEMTEEEKAQIATE